MNDISVITNVTEQLRKVLPSMATDWITARHAMDDPANQSFADHPDNPAEHSPDWHQYGILTHSIEFGNVLREQVPAYMREWGLREQVDAALSQEIDGLTKRQLLGLAALVHDTGKFTARTVERQADGSLVTHFLDHEAQSGEIVRHELRDTLSAAGLSDAQIEYIATCAQVHFELGKMRRASKEEGGYTMMFAETGAFAEAARKIMEAHPDYALEIGLQFIADSLSKTEVAAKSATDASIAAERPALEAEIADKGLNPNLINQALQQPVNMRVAQEYLRLWAASL